MSQKSGLQVYQDSGAPKGSTDYTTLILLHGYAFHGGIFTKLLPLSEKHNTRVVLVNRRDYPGAVPYSKEERAPLDAAAAEVASDPAAAREKLVSYMEYNARELYDFLVEFVAENDVPKPSARRDTGGIVLGGWSFAGGWMISLLAFAESFPVGEVHLTAYVRRVILYDAPYHVLGYPPLNGDMSGSPLFNPAIAADEQTQMRVAGDWVSGYFKHANFADGVERYAPLADPAPTISTMSPAELAAACDGAPVDPAAGGSDSVLNYTGISSGVWQVVRERALRGPQHGSGGDRGDRSRSWADVELCYLWCNATVWEIVWGVHCMKREVREAREAGANVRKVTYVQIQGGNHFIHWDRPEDAMRACLAETSEKEEVVIGSV